MVSASKTDLEVAANYAKVLEPKIKEVLTAATSPKWAGFLLLKDEQSSYVLSITTPDPDDAKWKQVKESLDSFIQKNSKEKINVKISKNAESEDIRNVVPREAQPYFEEEPWSRDPFGVYSLGRSIGVEQLDFPGTLGGFITVQYKGTTRVYGLTNNHVVNVGKATNKQSTDPTYINTGNQIFCPNYHDLEATKLAHKGVKMDSVKVGKLSQASGRTLALPQGATQYCILDWALIELNSEALKKMQEAWRKMRPNAQIPRNSDVAKAAPFPADLSYVPTIRVGSFMEVVKWGRTTSVTLGEVAMTKKTMNITDTEQWKGSIDNPTKIQTHSEWVVPAAHGKNFVKGGDSGSFVFDREGHLVALAWALTDADETIITDIHTVFESIRAKEKMDNTAVFGIANAWV